MVIKSATKVSFFKHETKNMVGLQYNEAVYIRKELNWICNTDSAFAVYSVDTIIGKFMVTREKGTGDYLLFKDGEEIRRVAGNIKEKDAAVYGYPGCMRYAESMVWNEISNYLVKVSVSINIK